MRMGKPSPQILLNYGMILHALDRTKKRWRASMRH